MRDAAGALRLYLDWARGVREWQYHGGDGYFVVGACRDNSGAKSEVFDSVAALSVRFVSDLRSDNVVCADLLGFRLHAG